MKYSIALLLSFLLYINLNAQEQEMHKFGISYTPSALLNTYPMLQFGASLITPSSEFYIDYGKVVSTKHSGNRLKVGIKKFKNNPFIENTSYYEVFILSRNTVSVYDTDRYTRKVRGIAGGYGFSQPLMHGILFQVGFGIGLGTIDVKTDIDPDFFDILFIGARAATYSIDGNYFFPIVYTNLKVIKTF